ncbi:hypothetical protein BDV93DRAFT_514751 [Ceratobasidium sp. AG-I]|nr:hypothetical protein BDV93DRAFT_514751 [Ceratobasidium sp. AG-I]
MPPTLKEPSGENEQKRLVKIAKVYYQPQRKWKIHSRAEQVTLVGLEHGKAQVTNLNTDSEPNKGELDVGDEPDEGVPPRTPPSSIEVKVALDKINASSKCEYTYMTYHCNVLVKPLCHLLKQTPDSAAGY